MEIKSKSQFKRAQAQGADFDYEDIPDFLKEAFVAKNRSSLIDFIAESNKIEGITEKPSEREIIAYEKFIELERLDREALIELLAIVQPGARIRAKAALDVRVGNYFPPLGGAAIPIMLDAVLSDANLKNDPWQVHVEFEKLHPFTDGNGRTGRAVWLWMMDGKAPLGFLHTHYYQTLAAQHGSF